MVQTLKCFIIIFVDTNYLLQYPSSVQYLVCIVGRKNRITWIRVSMVSHHLLVDYGLEVLLHYRLDSN